jgi:hypothetical protein
MYSTYGIHTQYWGAWNEPDITANDRIFNASKTGFQTNYPQIAATYAVRADEALQKHGVGLKTAPAASCGGCEVIAGEFADPVVRAPYFKSYRLDIASISHTDDKAYWKPLIWSYHAYWDISSIKGAPLGNSTYAGTMASTLDMENTFGQSAYDPGRTQLWMTEGGVAEQLGQYRPISALQWNSTGGECYPPSSASTTATETSIGDAVDRFLSFTSTYAGNSTLDSSIMSGSGLSASLYQRAHEISAAIYYSIAPAGSGPGAKADPSEGIEVYDNCNNEAIETTGRSPGQVEADQFDSGLYESPREAYRGGSSTVRPRTAFCALTNQAVTTNTPCSGDDEADPEPVPNGPIETNTTALPSG